MAISAVTASVSAQTQYPMVVNGVLCYSATDVAEARNQYPILVNGTLCYSATQIARAQSFQSPQPTQPAAPTVVPSYTASGNPTGSAATRGTVLDVVA